MKNQRYRAIQPPIATLPRPRPARMMLMFQMRKPTRADETAPVFAIAAPAPFGLISRLHIGPAGFGAWSACVVNLICCMYPSRNVLFFDHQRGTASDH